MTCANDATVRLWMVEDNGRKSKQVKNHLKSNF